MGFWDDLNPSNWFGGNTFVGKVLRSAQSSITAPVQLGQDILHGKNAIDSIHTFAIRSRPTAVSDNIIASNLVRDKLKAVPIASALVDKADVYQTATLNSPHENLSRHDQVRFSRGTAVVGGTVLAAFGAASFLGGAGGGGAGAADAAGADAATGTGDAVASGEIGSVGAETAGAGAEISGTGDAVASGEIASVGADAVPAATAGGGGGFLSGITGQQAATYGLLGASLLSGHGSAGSVFAALGAPEAAPLADQFLGGNGSGDQGSVYGPELPAAYGLDPYSGGSLSPLPQSHTALYIGLGVAALALAFGLAHRGRH